MRKNIFTMCDFGLAPAPTSFTLPDAMHSVGEVYIPASLSQVARTLNLTFVRSWQRTP